MPTPTPSVPELRRLLNLTQRETAALLGLTPTHLSRSERTATFSSAVERLIRGLCEIPLGSLEAFCRAMVAGATPDEAEGVSAALAGVKAGIKALQQGGAPAGATLSKLLANSERPSEWVYWASSRVAPLEQVLAQAREDGFIVRPLRHGVDPKGPVRKSRGDGPTDYPWLNELKHGDQVLLMHDGEPVGWFTLSSRFKRVLPPRAPEVPAVFRFEPSTSPLGRRLRAEAKTRYWNGHDTAAQGWFSGLNVAASPRRVVKPKARVAGNRAALVPFEAA